LSSASAASPMSRLVQNSNGTGDILLGVTPQDLVGDIFASPMSHLLQDSSGKGDIFEETGSESTSLSSASAASPMSRLDQDSNLEGDNFEETESENTSSNRVPAVSPMSHLVQDSNGKDDNYTLEKRNTFLQFCARPPLRSCDLVTMRIESLGEIRQKGLPTTVMLEPTTVMWRNIPKGLEPKDLLNILNGHGYRQLYNFVHYPMSVKKGRLRYCILNFIDFATALKFRKHFTGFTAWGDGVDTSAGAVRWGHLQGQYNLLQRYQNSKPPRGGSILSASYKPMLFENGKQVPFLPFAL